MLSLLIPICILLQQAAVFYGNGMFIKGLAPASNDLEDAFCLEIFKFLIKKSNINTEKFKEDI